MHVLLDVTRLLECGRRRTPTGIDRVEVAYVRRWIGEAEERVTFVAPSGWGDLAAVPRDTVAAMLDALDLAWSGQPGHDRAAARAGRIGSRALSALLAGIGRRVVRRAIAGPRRCIYLLVSHRALEQPEPIERLREQGVAFVPLIHDLIPATHPEYVRPGAAMQHLRRIATVAALADGVIVNSASTAEVLGPHLVRSGPRPPVVVAPLGVALPDTRPAAPAESPYFVVLGTVEPRKNHLLLLHLWREFGERLGPAAPRLVLVGRRGWENENVLDMLDRCTLLRGLVQEESELTDAEIAALLRGSRALLFPSFAEGYGLPLAEALSLGVPAICSDLPALREVGGDAPDYLDPLDGPGWRRLIRDYAEAHSPARAAQLARLAHWVAPGWDEHFDRVDALLAAIARRPRNGVETASGPRQPEPRREGPLVAEPRINEPLWGDGPRAAAVQAPLP